MSGMPVLQGAFTCPDSRASRHQARLSPLARRPRRRAMRAAIGSKLMAAPSRLGEPSPARQPDFAAQLQRWQARVESELTGRLPAVETQPTRLHEAIRYRVLGGGKRVRP